MLIWIFLKDEIMDNFYGNGNEEKRKKFLDIPAPIMS